MADKKEKGPERILILCVDRDNDVGGKAGVRTPIIGREEVMKSALKLVLADPEEADANAMFEALRIYDTLGKDSTLNNPCEVAVISGSELGGIAADRKLVSELSDVLKIFQADSLILVTDGFSDKEIMPLIQSRVPVTSLRRVVVKHSETVEETAAVFSRYLRMLVEDPRYSKIALGLPGMLLLSLGILTLLGVFLQFDIYLWTWIVLLIIVGSSLLGKGYGLDKKIAGFFYRIYHYSVSGLVASFSLVTGLLLICIGFYQAGSYISTNYDLRFQLPVEIGKFLELLPQLTGWMIKKSIDMVVVGICIILAGRSIAHLLERDSRFWRTSALVAIFAWSWMILNELSIIILDPSLPPDGLIVSVIVGIIVIVASGLAAHLLGKKYQKIFRERHELKEAETTNAEQKDIDK